uniref:hypothetical protein n=1 Tax=Paenibacillus glycanilyticus TaxID=126569 RepID=UPI001F30DA91|nr:hypothetical protein [Paenibacillus glycanilyticus]
MANPLTELPLSVDEIFRGIDAVIITHLHGDHYDDAAKEKFCLNLTLRNDL